MLAVETDMLNTDAIMFAYVITLRTMLVFLIIYNLYLQDTVHHLV